MQKLCQVSSRLPQEAVLVLEERTGGLPEAELKTCLSLLPVQTLVPFSLRFLLLSLLLVLPCNPIDHTIRFPIRLCWGRFYYTCFWVLLTNCGHSILRPISPRGTIKLEESVEEGSHMVDWQIHLLGNRQNSHCRLLKGILDRPFAFKAHLENFLLLGEAQGNFFDFVPSDVVYIRVDLLSMFIVGRISILIDEAGPGLALRLHIDVPVEGVVRPPHRCVLHNAHIPSEVGPWGHKCWFRDLFKSFLLLRFFDNWFFDLFIGGNVGEAHSYALLPPQLLVVLVDVIMFPEDVAINCLVQTLLISEHFQVLIKVGKFVGERTRSKAKEWLLNFALFSDHLVYIAKLVFVGDKNLGALTWYKDGLLVRTVTESALRCIACNITPIPIMAIF